MSDGHRFTYTHSLYGDQRYTYLTVDGDEHVCCYSSFVGVNVGHAVRIPSPLHSGLVHTGRLRMRLRRTGNLISNG